MFCQVRSPQHLPLVLPPHLPPSPSPAPITTPCPAPPTPIDHLGLALQTQYFLPILTQVVFSLLNCCPLPPTTIRNHHGMSDLICQYPPAGEEMVQLQNPQIGTGHTWGPLLAGPDQENGNLQALVLDLQVLTRLCQSS